MLITSLVGTFLQRFQRCRNQHQILRFLIFMSKLVDIFLGGHVSALLSANFEAKRAQNGKKRKILFQTE
jgi:hypothetical protein